MSTVIFGGKRKLTIPRLLRLWIREQVDKLVLSIILFVKLVFGFDIY